MSIHAQFRCRGWQLCLMIVTCLIPTPGTARDFFVKGVEGQIDLQLAYGLQTRLEDPDEALIATAQGGTAFSANFDDGNLNYDKNNFAHNMVRLTGELVLGWRNFGLFARGYGFYDFENEDSDRERTDLGGDAGDLLGSDVELLDAYISARFEGPGTFQAPIQMRLGDQVRNWGESIFFPGGVGVTNPLNIPLFNQPVSTIRDLHRPIGMLWASSGFTELYSVEVYYAYEWKKTLLNPVGGYHNANDITAPGHEAATLGFGDWSDLGTDRCQAFNLPAAAFPDQQCFDRDFLTVTDISTNPASDSGQWGIRLQSTIPQLNDSNLSAYFVNYHADQAVLSVRVPGEDTIAQTTPEAIAAQAARMAAGVPGLTSEDTALAAFTMANSTYTNASVAILEYVENIKMFGFSFNTTTIKTGTALSGEISHHLDVPVQIDDAELVAGAFTQFQSNPAFLDNQVTNGEQVAPNQVVQGFLLEDKTQLVLGFTQLLGARLGAAQAAIAGEVGWTHFDLPSKNELRLDGPGTTTSGNPRQSLPAGSPDKPVGGIHAGKPAEGSKHFADDDSWGYRLAASLTYQNILGAFTVRPRVIWRHDVNGVSPAPGTNFIEGRKAITLGVNVGYLADTLTADVSYSGGWGGGRHNITNDRDFFAFNLKFNY